MVTKSLLVLALCCLVSMVLAQSAFVWQGMEYQWLRKDLDFETPHRFGSFSNFLSSKQNFTSQPFSSSANLEITPGVNGDYSYPTIFYDSFAPSQSSSASNIVIHQDAQQSFQDILEHDNFGTPYASNVRTLNIGFYPQTQLINEGSFSNYAVVLRGFNLTMQCSDSKPDTTCNSNGIWPSYLSLSLECNNISPTPSSPQIGCQISFFLNRTEIPFHFKYSKPLNTVMQYQLTVGTTLIVANKASGPNFPAYRSILVDNSLPAVSVSSSIEYPAFPTNRLVTYSNLVNTTTYNKAVVGITGFAFTLEETLDIRARGRYLEGISMFVFGVDYNAPKASCTFNATMGIGTTLTNMPVKYTASIQPAIIQIADPGIMIGGQQTANATICYNDKAFPYTFHCKSHGLPTQPSETIKLTSDL